MKERTGKGRSFLRDRVVLVGAALRGRPCNRTRRLTGVAMRPRQGQVLVMFALLAVVLIGFVALSIDLGITYSQRRAMQNSADASSLAAANQLAKNIVPLSDGTISFVMTDSGTGGVRDTVQKYFDSNKGWTPSGAVYKSPPNSPCGTAGGNYCLQYLDQNGNVLANSPISTAIPKQTAMVRVYVEVDFSTLFAPVLGKPKMQVTASATAQISPVAKPASPQGNVWPMTRYAAPSSTGWLPAPTSNVCPNPMEFWASNPYGYNGNWKGLLSYSRMSQKDPTKQQLITKFDPVDRTMEEYFLYGWNGQFTARQQYLTPASTWPSDWQTNSTWRQYNDKVEIGPNGDGGANVHDNMRTFVTNHVMGTDSCGGDYTIVNVYVWYKAESWDGTKYMEITNPTQGSNPNQIARVSLYDYYSFKIYYNSVGGSTVYGYPVAIDATGLPPQSGPPSGTANTVHLVG